MNRFSRCLLLSAALTAPLAALAQPVAAPAASSALEQASQREALAIRARDEALQTLRSREADMLAAGSSESAERRRISGQLEAENQAIIALLDRLEGINTKPRHLIAERAILDDWYTALQPAAANLTENSFVGLEAELAGLAASGAIEASTRRYPSLLAVRNRLAEIGQQLTAANAEAQRQSISLRQELERRAQVRERLRVSLARAAPQNARALPAWQEATTDLARAIAALDEAQGAVAAAATAALEERPPILAEVRLSAPEGMLYRGEWVRGTAASADERDRAAQRAPLLRQREEFEAELGVRGIEWRDRNAELTESAERMHVLGTAIAASGDRYKSKREIAVYQAIAAEIGVTIAEVVLTGGAATLARRSGELAETAVQRHATHAAAQEAGLALGASEARLAARAAQQQVSLVTERASASAALALSRGREQMVERLVRSGTGRQAAEAQAEATFGPAIRNAIDSARRAAIDARVARETARLADAPPGLLGTIWEETQQEVVAKFLATAAMLSASSSQPNPGAAAPLVDTTTSTALGETLEAGLGTSIDAGSIIAQALRLKARSPIPLGTQVSLASIKSGVGALAGIYKVALAQQFDVVVNNEAQYFGNMMAELSYRYATHRAKLQALRQFEAESNRLKAGIFQINAALKLLDAGPELRATPSFVQVPKGAKLTLDLGFSAPLTAAPAATVEGAPMALTLADGLGMRWRGTFVVTGETGVRRLAVSAGSNATPYGSLDSVPGTLAVRLGMRAGWRGFETGVDTKHFLPVIVRKDPDVPAAPVDIVRGNEAVYRASDLSGLWRAVGYECDGPTGEEIVRISTGNGTDIVAVKERGDNCIYTEDVTWRGRLSSNYSAIQGEFHTREPNRPNSEGAWIPLTIRVISRDELEGMGVRYIRIKTGP